MERHFGVTLSRLVWVTVCAHRSNAGGYGVIFVGSATGPGGFFFTG
jgi:hypothetical protein